jgi:hypothetical protein
MSPSWPEAFIARRDAARRFLAGCGAEPFLLNRDATRAVPNVWTVPGWNGTFHDHDLIVCAERMGMARG